MIVDEYVTVSVENRTLGYWVSGYKNQIIEEIGKGMEEYVLCIHL